MLITGIQDDIYIIKNYYYVHSYTMVVNETGSREITENSTCIFLCGKKKRIEKEEKKKEKKK